MELLVRAFSYSKVAMKGGDEGRGKQKILDLNNDSKGRRRYGRKSPEAGTVGGEKGL